MSNADKTLCPVKPRGEYAPQGHCLYHVVHMQHTSASLCVCTGMHVRMWGAEFTHAHRCMCTSPPVALVQACAGWGLAHLWHCLYALPICRECPGPGGAGWPGNLSQLLCPVSGKPPAGILPTEPACPCTCPLGFPEGPRRPSPQPRMPESTAHTHTMQGVCNPLPPTLSEALTARTRREPSRAESASGVKACAHDPQRESRCPYGSLHIVGTRRHRGSIQQVIELGKCLHYPDDHTCTGQNAGEHALGFFPLCGCLHRPGHFKVCDVPTSGCLRTCLCLCSVGVCTLRCYTQWVVECQCLHTVGG